VFLYFKFLERDGNRGLGLLPLYSLDWIGLDDIQLASAFRNLGSMSTSINNSTESKKMLKGIEDNHLYILKTCKRSARFPRSSRVHKSNFLSLSS